MNFQLPKQDEDFDYYGNSSQDESRGSQGRQFGYARNFTFFFSWPFFLVWVDLKSAIGSLALL